MFELVTAVANAGFIAFGIADGELLALGVKPVAGLKYKFRFFKNSVQLAIGQIPGLESDSGLGLPRSQRFPLDNLQSQPLGLWHLGQDLRRESLSIVLVMGIDKIVKLLFDKGGIAGAHQLLWSSCCVLLSVQRLTAFAVGELGVARAKGIGWHRDFLFQPLFQSMFQS